MSLKGKSLAILTPMMNGDSKVNYFSSSLMMKQVLTELRIKHEWITVYNESLVTRARNRLVDRYLKCFDLTHALFIDADIGFDPRDILAMLEMDHDVLGVPCSKKAINWQRVQKAVKKNGRQFSDDELTRVGGNFVFNLEATGEAQSLDMLQVKPVKHLGTGLMMVRREVFQKMAEAYPDRWYDSRAADPGDQAGPIHDFFRVGVNEETRQYDSEDYWFCMDAKAIGFQPMLWMQPRTTHMGTYSFVADMPAVAKLVGEL